MFAAATATTTAAARSRLAALARPAGTRGLKTLVTTSWLADNAASTVILDGSWHMPATRRDPLTEYTTKRIPNARFFDIEAISDKDSPLPHMLPSVAQFSQQVGDLGINENDHIVVYDTTGVGSACRVYWTFRVFGHDKISILDGGLPKWIAEMRPVETTPPTPTPLPRHHGSQTNVYFSRPNPLLVKHYDDIVDAYTTHVTQIVDARPAGRFQGVDPEPRPGLSSGHVPTSINIPSTLLTDPVTKTLLPKPDLVKVFSDKGVHMDRPIIATCGSGVNAAVVFVALKVVAEGADVAVYDGSWTDYAARPGAIIQKDV